jgi:hypothetical protein
MSSSLLGRYAETIVQFLVFGPSVAGLEPNMACTPLASERIADTVADLGKENADLLVKRW